MLAVLLLSVCNTTTMSNAVAPEVLVYCGNDVTRLYERLADECGKYGILSKKIDHLDKDSKKLHIIADAFLIPFRYFPEHYIVYQTLHLDEVPLTKAYLDKLNKAVAIWDPSWKNISKYSLLCPHYYYVGQLTNSVLLPCKIPPSLLSTYTEILQYSNSQDTDISSHLPTIFAHCVMKQPKIIIEVGVRSGESTVSFKKAAEYSGAKLIGVDIDIKSADVYAQLKIKNAEFRTMNDVDFADWWHASEYKGSKADIIFIDTSHLYEHTVQELEVFVPLLADDGLLVFHDTNMTPLTNCTYKRINNTRGKAWDNKKGVIRGIKDFFSLEFDEAAYTQLTFSSKGTDWSLAHYPYCNGLTLIQRLG